MKRLSVFCSVILFASCATAPPNTFVLTPELLQQRQLESRRFEGISETELLTACSNVLQDLGFNLENSETKLGVFTASKQRSAVNAAEIAAAVLVAVLGGGYMATSKDQTIRVAVVVRPVSDSAGEPMKDTFIVRATFQRLVRRTDGTTYAETMTDPTLFQEFYDKLSKSVFLEAQQI